MYRSTVGKLTAPFAAIVVGLGLVAAVPAGAEAGQSRFEFGIYGSNGHIVIGPGRSHGSRYRDYRHYRPRDCHPRRAIRTAERRGVRHARVERIGERFIAVKGYRRGHRVKIGFDRHSRHCDMAWVTYGGHRHENRRRHGYRRSYSYYPW